MKTKITIVVAILVMLGVSYWAFDMVRQRTYAGSSLSFEVGSGEVYVTNPGSEAVPVEMRTVGRTATFRVESRELELRESAKRQGSGRDIYYAVAFEIPSGQATIDVTRGSGVWFVSSGSGRLNAVVTPMGVEGTRLTLGFAGAVILLALYIISKSVNHRWIGALRNRITQREPTATTAPPPPRTT